MTQLLIRLFIRHPDNPQDPHTRAAYGNLASIVGMVCNVLLCLAARCGHAVRFHRHHADALNNLSDASSNIVSLVGSSWRPEHRTRNTPSAMPGMSIWAGWWSA